MIKRFFGMLTLLCLGVSPVFSQPDLPEFKIMKQEVAAQLNFLASDDLQGRRTGSPGNNMAARFIAEQLRAYGYEYAPGLDSYYQRIGFVASKPPTQSALTIGKANYQAGEEFLLLAGDAANISKASAVYAGHGWVDAATGHDDYANLDVKGKVVFVLPGRPDSDDPMSVFNAMAIKRDLAYERGAVALIELYRLSFPWNFFTRYFGRETLGAPNPNANPEARKLVYGWVKEKTGNTDIRDLIAGDNPKLRVNLSSSGFQTQDVPSQNVIGVLEGTDPQLKNEYILLSAHYDHVGVGKEGGNATTPTDSIFNGARDNAMGTVALLTAAKALALTKPKRSVIILAVTGEELGLLGSQYYAQNPLIPLDKVIFNLNTDGAGYNDTDYVAVIGWGRTGTDPLIEQATQSFGLKIFPDPAPEQGLFDRSDNVSFAAKGVPALNYSPGLTAFDEEIGKYYHQVTDESRFVDKDYLLKYCQSFAYLARLVAEMPGKPQWKAGDKYEEAGKALYNK